VVNVETEARARTGRCPLEHLQVAVGIAERGDGPPANGCLDADRLSGAIIDEIDLRQFDDRRFAVVRLELQLDGVPMTCSGGTP
jgi:hypothetical protein